MLDGVLEKKARRIAATFQRVAWRSLARNVLASEFAAVSSCGCDGIESCASHNRRKRCAAGKPFGTVPPCSPVTWRGLVL